MAGGTQRAPCGHAEVITSRTVGVQLAVDDATIAFVLLQKHRGSCIPKEHTGGAVRVVDDGAHLVGTHDDHVLGRAVFHELCAGFQGKQKAAASRTQVKPPCFGGTRLVANEVGRGGEQHVGGYRGANDEVNVSGGEARLGTQGLYSLCTHVGRGLVGVLQDATLFDACPSTDPFIGGVDHLFEVRVGEFVFGQIPGDTCDCSCHLHRGEAPKVEATFRRDASEMRESSTPSVEKLRQ